MDVEERLLDDWAMEKQWQAVGTAVSERMLTLGLDAATVARKAELSPTVVGQIINASKTGYRVATLSAVAVALGWTPDSLARILRGEAPVETGRAEVREVATKFTDNRAVRLRLDSKLDRVDDALLAELERLIDLYGSR